MLLTPCLYFCLKLAVRVPLTDPTDIQGNVTWKQWNHLRTLAEYNSRIGIALELTSELPHDKELLDMWFAEPIKTVIIPGEIFISNSKGYPVLPKAHQNFVKQLMVKVNDIR